MQFSFPVELTFNNRCFTAIMGPFQHSTEREFAMAVNRKALKDCQDKEQLRQVAGNLLEGWAAMNTAFQSIMKENIELRQALAVRDSSLEAADMMLTEAGRALQQYEQQSKKAKRSLLPWRW
jgi:hypothetical protein